MILLSHTPSGDQLAPSVPAIKERVESEPTSRHGIREGILKSFASLAIVIVLAVSAMGLTSVSEAIPPSLDERVSEFAAVADELGATGDFSGSVLVAWQGDCVFEAAYGMADRTRGIPNQIDTKFNLASMDKMFTAVAILQLVEEGLVALDDTVGVYLPEYPNRDVAHRVTIEELLTHTSGLGDYFESPTYLDVYDKIRSLDDYLALFADEPLLFPPGTDFQYSNSGFIVLGLIIEAVTGVSYYDYVRDHIFLPTGMLSTACYELDAGTPNLAIGYTTRDENGDEAGVLRDNSLMLPMRGGSAGGGFSTAPDLLAFANGLMENRLLTAESTQLALEAKVYYAANAGYGYGFFVRVVENHLMVGHGGSFPGICSMLSIYPDLDYTVIILSNSDHGCADMNEAVKAVLLN
jgi:D-alanyl-D-alanine carboxypeptidase